MVLLIPYWLLICPIYLFYVLSDDNNRWYTENWYGIPLIVLFPLSSLVGSVSTYLCLSNKFSIKNGRIVLPPPRFGSFPVDSLTGVQLEKSKNGRHAKALRLTFEVPTATAGKKNKLQAECESPQEPQYLNYFERISLSRIPGKKAKHLLKLIETSCPRCVINDEAKNFLLGQHAQQFQPAEQSSDKLKIQYHAHERIRNFIALIKSYESYFWKVYLSVCLLPIIMLAPMPIWLVPALMARMQGKTMPPPPSWCYDWFGIFGKAGEAGGKTLEGPVRLYFDIMTNPVTVCVLTAFTGLLLYRFCRFLLQPNELIVDESGFSLKHVTKGRTLSATSFNWKDFSRVTLQKPKGSTAAEQWQVAFHRTNGKKPVALEFSAIKGEGDRDLFISAIEVNAPHLTRDPELIEAFKPAQKQSYTELWLQSLTTPPKRERLAPLTPGQVIKAGKYIITEQLGTGGQGVAYLGTATDSTKETIVVKEFVLPVFVDKVARKQALEKFENEAVLLRGLNHPRVVKLMDYFIEDHRGYLVLEHINGLSLRKLVEQDGPFSQERVIELAKQMCDILTYLHSLTPPLVHRDFTPDNLILNSDGVLKLIDFNVAHQKDSRTKTTVVGKHAYLPPEQFRGKPVPQSDIYAMGATLHYLLIGDDPEPVSVANPMLFNEQIEPKLNAIVAKATALELKTRFADAAEIQVALDASDRNAAFENSYDDGFVIPLTPREEVMAEEIANG